MKRIAILVLVLAVLIGTVAGAYTAYLLHADRRLWGTPRDPTSSGPGSPGSPGVGDLSLFYFAGNTIHDGNKIVPVTLSREYQVSAIQRIGDGWLIAQLHSEGGEQEDYYGTYVYPDGRTWDLGQFGQSWDVDSDGRILFSLQSWSWSRADPATHQVRYLEILDGSGDEPSYMRSGEPAAWIQVIGDDVVTGWSTSEGGRMVRTDIDDHTHTEVGPIGASRPNIAPDGELMVDNPLLDSQAQCLTGGVVTGDDWWESCDFVRFDYVSPYAPDSEHLLTRDIAKKQPRNGYGELAVLDARTGKPSWRIDPPEPIYDAAWADNRTVNLLVHPGGDKSTTVVYSVGPDGKSQRVSELDGTATLGSV